MEPAERERILKFLGIFELSKEHQDEIIASLDDYIARAVVLRSMEVLDEKTRLELAKINDSEKAVKFMAEKIPDFKNFVKQISIACVGKFKERIQGII